MLRKLPNNSYTIWKSVLKYVETMKITPYEAHMNNPERVKEGDLGFSAIQLESGIGVQCGPV